LPWLTPVWPLATVEVEAAVVVLVVAAFVEAEAAMSVASEAVWVGFTHPVPRFPVHAQSLA
jgi:hypothetical protein